MKDSPRIRSLLREALRRWQLRPPGQHTGGQTITIAWTGLGSATQYAPAVEAGYMECATNLNPGHSTWWRLTEDGAAAMVVLGWLDE